MGLQQLVVLFGLLCGTALVEALLPPPEFRQMFEAQTGFKVCFFPASSLSLALSISIADRCLRVANRR